jgi:hypothetical protein
MDKVLLEDTSKELKRTSSLPAPLAKLPPPPSSDARFDELDETELDVVLSALDKEEFSFTDFDDDVFLDPAENKVQ